MKNHEVKNYILVGESPIGYSHLNGARFRIEKFNNKFCIVHSLDGKINFSVDPEVIFMEDLTLRYTDYPDKQIDSYFKHDLIYNGKKVKKYRYPQAVPMWLLKLRGN